MSNERQYNKLRLGKLVVAVILSLVFRYLILGLITMELNAFLEFVLYAILFTIVYGILFSIDFSGIFKKK